LLFQVNGGAFAIASLLGDPKTSNFITGILGLRTLGIGMVLFTRSCSTRSGDGLSL
jgi:hypothetical protein